MIRGSLSLVMLLFFLMVMLLLPIIFLLGVGSAFESIGIPSYIVPSLLIFSLIGSMINIPVYTYLRNDRQIEYYYFTQEWSHRKSRVYINLGGCVIPISVSIYIVLSQFSPKILLSVVVTALVVALVSKKFARVVPRLGITMPMFIPPMVTALTAVIIGLILDIEQGIFIASYAGGVIGVILGADVLNLRKVMQMGAPKVAIGGAGTFDGIFLTGILSVMLVAFIY